MRNSEWLLLVLESRDWVYVLRQNLKPVDIGCMWTDDTAHQYKMHA